VTVASGPVRTRRPLLSDASGKERRLDPSMHNAMDRLGVRIGYQSFMPDEDPLESVDFAVGLGLALIELNANMPWFFPERFDRGLRAALRDKSRDAGVMLASHAPEEISLISPHPALLRAGVQRMKDFIDLAADLKAEVLTCNLGGNYLRWATGEARVLFPHQLYPERMAESLRLSAPDLAELAAGADVKLSLENAGCFEPTVIQKTVSEVLDVSPLHLTWDMGHSNTKDGRIEEQERFMLGRLERVALIHLHDNDGLVDAHAPLGTGTVDLSRALELARRGNVPVSIEVRPRSLIPACLEALLRISA
jgi:sugar phosphate isomerase/epimerase